MPSFYFDDVLRTANGHLDQNLWASAPKWDLWSLSAKCKPRADFEISHQRQWQSDWKFDKTGKNESETLSEKSQTNFKWNKDSVKYGFGMVNDSMKASAEGNLMNKDWKVDGKVDAAWKHSKKEWTGKATVTASSPVMAEKMRLWSNSELEMNESSVMRVLSKMNVSYDCYHIGVAGEHKGDNWEKQYAHFVWNDKSRQFWGRVNMMDSNIGLGCSIEHDCHSHSYEAQIDMGDSPSGLAGTPVSIVGGGEYELSKKHSINYTFSAAKHFTYNQNIEHKVDDKWTVELNQSFDAECLEKDRKKPAYDFGMGFTYKL